MRVRFLLPFILLFPLVAHAVAPDTPLTDRAQEERARALFAELRCVVCAGQTLADSDVAMARSMRQQVRNMIAAHESDSSILAYFTERYGKEVLTSPPTKGGYMALWLMPFVLLSLAAFGLWRFLHANKRP